MELIRCKEKLHDVDFYKARMEVSGHPRDRVRGPDRLPSSAVDTASQACVLGGSEQRAILQQLPPPQPTCLGPSWLSFWSFSRLQMSGG